MVSFSRYFTVCITYQPPLVKVSRSIGGMIRLTCLSATLSINNLLWTAQELNPDRGLTAYTTAQPLKTKIIVNFTFKDPVRTAQ